jgi:hypothetical protein
LIYTLAQAERRPSEARHLLWQAMKSHPGWMKDATFRRMLVHGVAHPAPGALGRAA